MVEVLGFDIEEALMDGDGDRGTSGWTDGDGARVALCLTDDDKKGDLAGDDAEDRVFTVLRGLRWILG